MRNTLYTVAVVSSTSPLSKVAGSVGLMKLLNQSCVIIEGPIMNLAPFKLTNQGICLDS